MNAVKKDTSSLPLNTNAALREVINTVANINDLYEEETKALIEIDTPQFFALQDKKIERAALYHAHMSEMIARKDEIKTADPALRARLKELQVTFHSLTEKNLEALERMQRCTERLAHSIRSAAVRAAQSQRNFSYGMNGTLSNSGKNKVISSGLSETA